MTCDSSVPHFCYFSPKWDTPDRIAAGRAELERLIGIVRKYPNLTAKQRANSVFKLYSRRIQELDSSISSGLFGTYMEPKDKNIIVQRWKDEKTRIETLAFQEIDPYLTAKQREVIKLLRDPQAMQQYGQQNRQKIDAAIQQREDARKLRGILPENQ